MPTVAQRRRTQEIRDLFRTEYASRVQDPAEVKKEFIARTGMNPPRWYNFLPDFRKMIIEAKVYGTHQAQPAASQNGHTEAVVVAHEPDQDALIIPSDLSEDGKRAFNSLMARYDEAISQVQTKEAENNTLRASLATATNRMKFIKKIAIEAMDAL